MLESSPYIPFEKNTIVLCLQELSMTLDFKEATSPIQNTIDFNMEENTIDFNMDNMKDMNIQHLLDINNRILLHQDNMDSEHQQWTLNIYIGLITKLIFCVQNKSM